MCIGLKCLESVPSAGFSVSVVEYSGSVDSVKLFCVFNGKYQAATAQDFEVTIFLIS
jgi:TRAP-type uncharacterized transport system substrate-binding protein